MTLCDGHSHIRDRAFSSSIASPEGTRRPVLFVRQALGLDDAPCWVIVSEHNVDEWPNGGLTPLPGRSGVFGYGFIPPGLFAQVKAKFLQLYEKDRPGACADEERERPRFVAILGGAALSDLQLATNRIDISALSSTAVCHIAEGQRVAWPARHPEDDEIIFATPRLLEDGVLGRDVDAHRGPHLHVVSIGQFGDLLEHRFFIAAGRGAAPRALAL